MKKLLATLIALTLILTMAAMAATKDEALTTAQQLAGEQAALVESDEDGGIYEFEFRDDAARYDVDILSASGDVVSFETEFSGVARATQVVLTEADAQDRVLAKFPTAQFYLTVAEKDDDGCTFEVFFADGEVLCEATVNAETGDLLRLETYPAAKGLLTADQVPAKVTAQAEGAAIVELELSFDDGKYVYEGEAEVNGKRYSFELDAATGNVLEWEIDD